MSILSVGSDERDLARVDVFKACAACAVIPFSTVATLSWTNTRFIGIYGKLSIVMVSPTRH